MRLLSTGLRWSKPSIEDTKNDYDVILLSREDVEIDDKQPTKPRHHQPFFLKAILPATTRQPATMMTTQPMGTVSQVPVLKAMLKTMEPMTVKAAFLC